MFPLKFVFYSKFIKVVDFMAKYQIKVKNRPEKFDNFVHVDIMPTVRILQL
jgi:hypothetical protein